MTRSAVVPHSLQASQCIRVTDEITAPSMFTPVLGRGVAQRLFIVFAGLSSTDNLRVRMGSDGVLLATGTCDFEDGGGGDSIGGLKCYFKKFNNNIFGDYHG